MPQAITRTELLAQKALELTGETSSIGHAMLYHLALRELALDILGLGASSSSPPEPHIGIALDRCSSFTDWVSQLDCPPDAPTELEGLGGSQPPKDQLNEILLLVAGRKNFAAVNHLVPDAWISGRAARISVLLHLGADINARYDYKGSTALHHLAALNDCASIEFCATRGADLNAQDNDQATPLFWAAKMKGRGASLATLVELGADVSATNEMNRTALHEVAFHGGKEMVNILVSLGAAPNASDGQVTPCIGHPGWAE